MMSWAGLERISRIQQMGYLKNLTLDVGGALKRAEASIRSAVVDGSLRNGPTDPTFDSSMLQLPLLSFPDTELCKKTVQTIAESLVLKVDGKTQEGFLYRYLRPDDFGTPKSSFLICSYWLVQALVEVGELAKAREIMEKLTTAANPLGLLSEHYDPVKHMQSGNFPQAYSHVGQILAAFAVSPSWKSVL